MERTERTCFACFDTAGHESSKVCQKVATQLDGSSSDKHRPIPIRPSTEGGARASKEDLSKQSVAPSRVKLKLAELIPAAHSGSASSGPRSSAAQTFAQDRGRSTVVPSMFDLVSHQLRLMCTDIWLASEVPPPYHYEIDLVLRSERVR